ncbi:hypothetical protein AB0F18_00920 [Streptomyces sp. NPDC029216]|uniref:hypothetical protein n=1 Tax=Streptomyces sp. NPDC029216 TaxID=3154701 RepID=UPI0034106723
MLYNVAHSAPDLDGVPRALRPFIESCLAKDLAARPTPEQLLTLLGRVAPADRPWPPAVHRTIAAQRAGIDRLLGDTDRTLVPEPAPAAPADAGTAEPRPTPSPTRPLPPPRRRTGKTIALVSACALAVAGIGYGVYALKYKEKAADKGIARAAIAAMPR